VAAIYGTRGTGNSPDAGYKTGLQKLDGDMPQYISDNTDDELSHELFINAVFDVEGREARKPGAIPHVGRKPVTDIPESHPKSDSPNLTQLSVDTSWWTRYRSAGPES